MADPTYKVTGAGTAAVNGDYEFVALHNLRPYYANVVTGVKLWWGTSVHSRWLLGTNLNWYGDTNYYWGWPVWAEWCYEVLQCAWGLGEHPDAEMPLPSLQGWAPPLGPSSSNLLIEGLGNPALVMDPTPHFTWEYEAGDAPGDQSAYRVLCATSHDLLTVELADLWDSGIVESSDKAATYAGETLPDREIVFTQVLVRDSAGVWSQP